MFLIIILFFLFFLGIPIAFSLGFTALIGLIISSFSLQVLVQRMFTGADQIALIAIPLFILAGNLMAEGGISKRITSFAESLLGHFPGGLGLVAIMASMIFAAVTGSAIAATAAIGGLLIAEMMRNNYSPEYSAVLVASAGSIGPIIPPSIPLVIYGVIVSASIAKLFVGGIIPGIMMGLSLMVTNIILSRKRNYRGKAEKSSVKEIMQALRKTILAVLMPIIVIGGIVGGIFTPTESSAIAVAYSLLVGGLVYKELTIETIWKSLKESAVTSGIILSVVMMASVFIWVMTVRMVPQNIALFLEQVIHSKYMALLVMNIVLLIAGTFIDTISALVIFVPLFLPLVNAMGIDLIHFGVVVAVNLTIGMCTPPLGVCLFVSCGIAKTTISAIFKDLLYFLVPLLVVLVLITYFPFLVTYLPSLMK